MAGIALQMLVCYMKVETILKDEHLPPTLYSPTPFFSFAHLCQRLYSLLCWEWQEDRLAGPGVRPQGATGPAPRASEVVGEAEFVSLFARWERRICWWGSKRHVFVKILRKL